MFSSKEKENESIPLFRVVLKSERIIRDGSDEWSIPLKPGHYKIVVQNKSRAGIQVVVNFHEKLEAKGGVEDEWGVIAHLTDKKRAKYPMNIKFMGENGTIVGLIIYEATKAYLMDYKKETEFVEQCKSLDLLQ